MKHAHNESANFIKSYAVHFDNNRPSNRAEMMPVIDMEAMVSRALHGYAGD